MCAYTCTHAFAATALCNFLLAYTQKDAGLDQNKVRLAKPISELCWGFDSWEGFIALHPLTWLLVGKCSCVALAKAVRSFRLGYLGHGSPSCELVLVPMHRMRKCQQLPICRASLGGKHRQKVLVSYLSCKLTRTDRLQQHGSLNIANSPFTAYCSVACPWF